MEPHNLRRYNHDHGQLHQMLEGLHNLEELYMIGYPARHLNVGQSDAPLLQTFEKLRIAVMDFHDAPVRSFDEKLTDIYIVDPARSSFFVTCICNGSALDHHNKT